MSTHQYGVAASSSIVKVTHPEDSQPNERIQGRNRQLPPKLNTVRQPRFDRNVSHHFDSGPQMARRGSWNKKVRPSRPRQASSSPEDYSASKILPLNGKNVLPEPPISQPTTSLPVTDPTTFPAQSASLSTWIPRYRSISPKLPPDPIRRRTPLDPPRPTDHRPVGPQSPRPSPPTPLPGRKRKQRESPSEQPPSQKRKIDAPESPPSQLMIKPESLSPEPITKSRRLVNEACSFWPIPDSCRKSQNACYSENRSIFAKLKSTELAKLGLQRTKAFFRDDGLVIEWRSNVPVWNDTLLPQSHHPRSITTPTKPPISSIHTNSENMKRKRDVSEIIDVDAIPTEKLQFKRLKPSDPDLATASARKTMQNSSSPKKRKEPAAPHWSVGLSKAEIQKLGRGVEASLQQHALPPTSSTLPAPPHSCDVKHKVSATLVTPVSSPQKRLALPTRLSPAERKMYSTSPERLQKAMSKSKVATDSSTAHTAAASNPSLAADSRRLNNKYVDVLLPRLSITSSQESANDVATFAIAGAPMSPSVDPSAAAVDVAPSEGGEEQKIDEGGHSDITQPTKQPGETRPDEAFLSEVKIARLCTDDIPVDIPEYEMAEDFLRRMICLFDTDRNELRMAYSKDAFLSCRVPDAHPEPSTSTQLPSSSSTLHFGRTEIIDKLNGLIGYYFSPVGVPTNTMHYDIAVLSQEVINSGLRDGGSIDEEAVGGILATLHSQIVRCGPGLEDTMTLHQSFILRRRTELDDCGENESSSKLSQWPLIVLSHQMVFRNEPLLPPNQVDTVSFAAQMGS